MYNDILCIILGGGRGTRLYPLTRDRAKPAVPLFGKYRLIDIPISNCLNSDFNRIKILTQFNSESLNKHITRTYKLDQFSGGFIEVIAADQTMETTDWFQGPADAVRKSLKHFSNPKIKYVCILSGDHLYKMDLRKFYQHHTAKKAEFTVACNLITADQVSSYGILGIDKEERIVDYVEKPKEVRQVSHLAVGGGGNKGFLCNMGIYFFNIETLRDLLTQSTKVDFGREIIPEAIKVKKASAFVFDGYWRDIGTIASFYTENLRLTEEPAPLDLYDECWPFFTRSRSLPPARIVNSRLEKSVVCDGSSLEDACVQNSIVGLRSRIGRRVIVKEAIIMGADYYETDEEVQSRKKAGIPAIGIGDGCVIERAILDKNVRIGEGVRITNVQKLQDHEAETYMIRDGIVIVYKNAVLPPGTVI